MFTFLGRSLPSASERYGLVSALVEGKAAQRQAHKLKHTKTSVCKASRRLLALSLPDDVGTPVARVLLCEII